MIEQLIRTRENWTYGIINIPLLYGHNNRNGINPRTIIRKVAHNAKCYRSPFPALDKSKRYLWFELDTRNTELHNMVLDFYSDIAHMDVYWHKTMKGCHYITVKPIPVTDYDAIVEDMKDRFNNGSFYYSLRIIPNKWVNEQSFSNWYNGAVVDNGSGHVKQLNYIKDSIVQPYTFNYNRTIPKTVQMLTNMFCISRYEFKGALKV